MQNDVKLYQDLLFPSAIYYADLPKFLPIIKKVSQEYLLKAKKRNKTDWILEMSDPYTLDPRVSPFLDELGKMCREIIINNGYYPQNLNINFTAAWTQEHQYLSSMEQHVHGHGEQFVGFYILEAPKDCGRAIFHDPRPGRVQINLPEADPSKATLASTMINYELVPGRVIIAPSWLPHSFSKNLNKKKSVKFVHFNVAIEYMNGTCPNNTCQPPAAEVV